MSEYFNNYLSAIDNPLPKLSDTFSKELQFLKRYINKSFVILDVGCGVCRPTDKLSTFVKSIAAVDNDNEMLMEAQKRCTHLKNISIIKADALNMPFKDNSFDVTYASYNLIGSIEKGKRQKLITEMTRVTKSNGTVINITWQNNKETTDFLKKYYPSIGINILDINKNKTVTDKGTFERILRKDLEQYYKKCFLKDIKNFDIGLWAAIVGIK